MPCCQDPAVANSLWLVLVGGLAGSLHCLGMCGPLVAAVEVARPGPFRAGSHLLMHAGRLVTYALLGLLAGLAGQALERGGAAAGVQGVAALVGGAAMALFALGLLGWIPGRLGREVAPAAVGRLVGAMTGRHPLGGFAIGLYWGLLPCGLVWAFLLRAAAAGSAIDGALVMLAFGAGTVPALLGAGALFGLSGPRVRAALPRIAAVTVLAMGALLVLRGAAGMGWIDHLHLAEGVALF